jgi:predicted nucleic acid-binding protein
MAIVADSGAIYGLYDRRDAFHAILRSAIEKNRDLIVLPAPALGEIDYLMRVRLGNPALLRFLADIQEGAFVVEPVTLADLRRCAGIIERYSHLDLGLADAAIVAVAERYGTDRILTVNQRDFRVLRSARGKPFRLLPADLRKISRDQG